VGNADLYGNRAANEAIRVVGRLAIIRANRKVRRGWLFKTNERSGLANVAKQVWFWLPDGDPGRENQRDGRLLPKVPRASHGLLLRTPA
jgi:hypothetical protein